MLYESVMANKSTNYSIIHIVMLILNQNNLQLLLMAKSTRFIFQCYTLHNGGHYTVNKVFDEKEETLEDHERSIMNETFVLP